MAATTLPALILGGEGEAAYTHWRKALGLPTVQGLVIGRSLLYPADGTVADAVDRAAGERHTGPGSSSGLGRRS